MCAAVLCCHPCGFLCVQCVGTIGPACQSVDVQVAMLAAGMSAARCGKQQLLGSGGGWWGGAAAADSCRTKFAGGHEGSKTWQAATSEAWQEGRLRLDSAAGAGAGRGQLCC
jgi:hypothetical protein